MSIKLMTTIFEADMTSVNYTIPATEKRSCFTGTLSSQDKFVLLALADNAADDGTSIFPSVETLRRKCQLSERGCRESLRRLEGTSTGLLILEHEACTLTVPTKAGPRLRSTRTYRIDIDILASLPRRPVRGRDEFEKGKGAPGALPQGRHAQGGGGATCRVEGAPDAPRFASSNHHEESPEEPKATAAAPDGASGIASSLEASPEKPSETRCRPTLTAGSNDNGSRPAAAPHHGGPPAIARYCNHWKDKYGESPTITNKRAGILIQIYKGLGTEPAEKYENLLDAFFQSRDPFVLNTAHSPEVFQTRLDALRVGSDARFSQRSTIMPNQELLEVRECKF